MTFLTAIARRIAKALRQEPGALLDRIPARDPPQRLIVRTPRRDRPGPEAAGPCAAAPPPLYAPGGSPSRDS